MTFTKDPTCFEHVPSFAISRSAILSMILSMIKLIECDICCPSKANTSQLQHRCERRRHESPKLIVRELDFNFQWSQCLFSVNRGQDVGLMDQLTSANATSVGDGGAVLANFFFSACSKYLRQNFA
jgi:hypothetical protein